MTVNFQKKSVLKKTFQVGGNTLISRIFGLVREILLMRYLGVGIVADAFTTAFTLPNSLRKIFAEGALTAAFVPTLVSTFKTGGKEDASRLTTIALLFFETLLVIVCLFVMLYADATIRMIAPGYSPEQIQATVPCLRILMPFIFFISTSALLAGTLQSVHHFFIPAFSPVLLNMVFIGALIICQKYVLNVNVLCFAILFAGFLQCILHILAYRALGFSFMKWNRDTVVSFIKVMAKFLLCFFGMSVMELSFLIDQAFASYLPVGSVTIIKYASRFMGLPLGVFAVAFSTILLPHFASLDKKDTVGLSFYLFESIKFVLWVMIPATLLMCFLSDQIFLTFFASSSIFPLNRLSEAGFILAGFLSGLCFFSLNKILFNVCYALHDTVYPTLIACIAVMINYGANCWLITIYGGFGLALATTVSGLVQMILCMIVLKYIHNIDIYFYKIISFSMLSIISSIMVSIPFLLLYKKIFLYSQNSYFFSQSFGFWLWTLPIIGFYFLCFYCSRKLFVFDLYYLNE